MKTIEDIAIECAKMSGHSYTNVDNFKPHNWVLQAMQEYAKQVAEAQRIQCAKEATCSIDWVDFHDFSLGINGAHVDDYSILEAELVTDNI